MDTIVPPGPDGNAGETELDPAPRRTRIDGADSWIKPTQIDARNS